MTELGSRFRQLSIDLLRHAAESFTRTDPTAPGLSPLVIPFTEDGPGQLLVFPHQDEGEGSALRRAHVELEKNAAQWIGYLLVHRRGLRSQEAAGELVLEGWLRDDPVHVVQRFDWDEAGSPRMQVGFHFVEKVPPNRLMMPKRQVTTEELTQLRAALAALAERAKTGLTGELTQDWTAPYEALPVSANALSTSEENWTWLESKRVRLEALVEMRAPAIIVEHEFGQVLDRLQRLTAL